MARSRRQQSADLGHTPPRRSRPTNSGSVNAAVGAAGQSKANKASTKNYTTVSSNGGPRRITKYSGTSIPPTRGVSKAARRATRVKTALKRVRKAYKSGPKYGKTFDVDEAATLAKSVGASNQEAGDLSSKLISESGGDPKAIGDDAAAGYGNTYGLGLWQITTGVGNDDTINKYGGRKAMLKPKPNARAALDILRSQGTGAWYGATGERGTPGKVAPKRKPKPKDLKLLKKAGVKARPTKAGTSAPDKPKKKPGQWAGSQKAVLSKVPKRIRDEGRGDKRTPAENSSVGGSTTSDHLTTNQKSYAADLPPDDAAAQKIAKRLGMASHTGTNEVVKNGYKYQLIWQDEGHYDHIHLGAEWVGKGLPPGTTLGGSSGGGGAIGAVSAATGASSAPSGGRPGGGTPVRGKKGREARKKKLARVRAAYSDTEVDASLDELEKRYSAVV